MTTLFLDLITISLWGAQCSTCARNTTHSVGIKRESAQLFIYVQKETWNLSCTIPTGSLLSNTFWTDLIIFKSICIQSICIIRYLMISVCWQKLVISLSTSIFKNWSALFNILKNNCHQQFLIQSATRKLLATFEYTLTQARIHIYPQWHFSSPMHGNKD